MIGGMDEAGRGPAIGPLVFGIVVATKKQLKKLEDLGIDDSKKLTREKREEYKALIEDNVTSYATLAVTAQDIDRLRDSFTLNEIEVNSFRELLEKFKEDITELQLDAADVNAERFGKQFEDMISGKIDSRHKGDSIFVAVGAASILAKVERDQLIDNIQEEMNEFDADLPSFGSGYPVQAKPFLEAYVKKYKRLPNCARKSWKTSKDAMEKYMPKQSALDDFL